MFVFKTMVAWGSPILGNQSYHCCVVFDTSVSENEMDLQIRSNSNTGENAAEPG